MSRLLSIFVYPSLLSKIDSLVMQEVLSYIKVDVSDFSRFYHVNSRVLFETRILPLALMPSTNTLHHDMTRKEKRLNSFLLC
jgi:hypothetical protein